VYWQVLMLSIAVAVAVVILGVAVFMPPAPPPPSQLYVKVVPSGSSYLLYVNDSGKALREVWYSKNGGPLLRADGPIKANCGDRVEFVAVYEDGSRQTAATAVKCTAPFKVLPKGADPGDTVRMALKASEDMAHTLAGKPATITITDIGCDSKKVWFKAVVSTQWGYFYAPKLGDVHAEWVSQSTDVTYLKCDNPIAFDNTGFSACLPFYRPCSGPNCPLWQLSAAIPLSLPLLAPAYAAGSDFASQVNATGVLELWVSRWKDYSNNVEHWEYKVKWNGQEIGYCEYTQEVTQYELEHRVWLFKRLGYERVPLTDDPDTNREIFGLLMKGATVKEILDYLKSKNLKGATEIYLKEVQGRQGAWTGLAWFDVYYDPDTGKIDNYGIRIVVAGREKLYKGEGEKYVGRLIWGATYVDLFIDRPHSTAGYFEYGLKEVVQNCLALDCSAFELYTPTFGSKLVGTYTYYTTVWGTSGGSEGWGGSATMTAYGIEVPGMYFAFAYYNATAPPK